MIIVYWILIALVIAFLAWGPGSTLLYTLGSFAIKSRSRRRIPDTDIGKCAGVYSIQGSRAHMEDTYQAAINLGGKPKHAFYGVYDGHGGHRASDFAAEHLHKLFLKSDYENNPVQSLIDAFKELDTMWLTVATQNNYDDGSTVICVLIVASTLYVANVGDSRSVIARGGKGYDMSVDHKPGREDEKKRIENLGGRIIYYGTWRVEGVLAVTRAIGDRRLKKYVSAVPEIQERKLQSDDEFLILATDGVWDVLSSQEAVDVIMACGDDTREMARRLTETAYKRGSMDNITSLVIDLRKYQ
jgi:protein phosphatase 1L